MAPCGRFLAVLFILGASASAAAGAPPDAEGCAAGATDLRWESFAMPFFETNCTPCHEWDNYCEVYEFRHSILDLVSGGNMPPFEPLPELDRERLAEWIGCGLPAAGPECPETGTRFGFRSFEGFLEARCGSCHSSTLQGEERQGAPPGQDWDDYAALKEHAPLIRESLLQCTMPPGGMPHSVELDFVLEWLSCGAPESPGGTLYRRGDANDDGLSNVSDAVAVLAYLFTGAIDLLCKDAADVDGDGLLNISDAVYLLAYGFLGGPPPPQPFDLCGSETRLGCAAFEHCQ